jgi:hypothetical protein
MGSKLLRPVPLCAYPRLGSSTCPVSHSPSNGASSRTGSVAAELSLPIQVEDTLYWANSNIYIGVDAAKSMVAHPHVGWIVVARPSSVNRMGRRFSLYSNSERYLGRPANGHAAFLRHFAGYWHFALLCFRPRMRCCLFGKCRRIQLSIASATPSQLHSTVGVWLKPW